MHLRISVPNNHQYKWRKNDHLSYTALSSAKTGLKLHYSSKHPVSAHCEVLTINLFAELIIPYSYLSQTHKETISNPNLSYWGFQLFFKNSMIKNLLLSFTMFIILVVHFLFRFPFSQYLFSKFNYKPYNPLI